MRTRVGYAGGTAEAPTYRRIGDHTEAIQVDFDAAILPYPELLQRFWAWHDPCRPPFSRQYRSFVAWDGEEQRRAAEASLRAIAAGRQQPVTTAVEPLSRFWLAEDHHQKHVLRRDRELLAMLRPWLADDDALRDSTLGARLNAFCHGDLPLADLRRELRRLDVHVVGERAIERLEAVAPPSPLAGVDAAVQARD